MMQRLLQSRSARKFRRNRLAIVALAVIAAYVLTAILVAGIIPQRATFQRVGLKNLPGLFLKPNREKNVELTVALIESVDQAITLSSRDRQLSPDKQKRRIASRLAAIRYGRIEVVDKPTEELRALVDQGLAVYDKLIEVDNIDLHPELDPQIEQLEKIAGQLLPHPSGWDGTVQNFLLLLGTDMQGRSISLRAVYSIQIAIQIGLVTALISVVIGSLLGTAAGFFGGWVDHLVTWLFTTFSSIPNLVLLVLLAYMFTGTILEGTLWPIYIAFSLTFWIGPCRVIRGETLKLKQLEYVEAATAVGFSRIYIMVRHILPNATHLMLINFSLLFIGAIKSEVILTYLGLGLKQGASWGIMIDQSRSEVLNGFFWQIGTATALMFGLVLAFNILSDALQDVFDPKHV